jgi:hypothetical protein
VTFNHGVEGSSPSALTKNPNNRIVTEASEVTKRNLLPLCPQTNCGHVRSLAKVASIPMGSRCVAADFVPAGYRVSVSTYRSASQCFPMKSFPDFREMNLKRMTDLIAARWLFPKRGYCHERSYCQASANRIGIVGRRSRNPYFNIALLWDRLARIPVGIDPGSIHSGGVVLVWCLCAGLGVLVRPEPSS